MSRRDGAQFVQYFGPVLDVLRALGGSGRPAEVTDAVASALKLSDKQQNELMKSGSPRFANQVAWARFYLSRDGYLDASKKGVWTLTEKGWKAHLSPEDSREIFLRLVRHYATERARANNATPQEATPTEQDQEPEAQEPSLSLLDLLKSLPAAGFERICQRLLREAGFRQVVVTGRSGDGGIDGHGFLEVNAFVSFKVLFQCKRYDKQVSPSHVREFQGAILGRADKGLILTTGTFTTAAQA